VRDTGIGIPQEKQAAIFSPFLQADSSTTRLYGGTGLGLTISARLVELMRGRIWLDSMPGEGSTFHFTLRLGLQDARNGGRTPPDADAAKERPARPLEVLLIEDNALNRRLAQLAIEKAGHRVLPLDNGAAGLDALARGRFDLVLMDVQMPRMDGIETTRRIREAEKSRGGHVQVIALTAHAMTRDRERCLQAGMDGYLVKPIQAASLIEAVERFHRSASPAQRRVDADALDRSALLERISGDGKLLGEITELFMHEAGRLIRDIRAAIEARDAAEFARCVHTLRGMLRSLSADSAAQLAETLQSLDPASDQQRTAEACEKLVQALAGVKADLRGLAGEVGLSEAAQG
jgi:CheY-like chemotaxis protein/HPt (histidine-containing phosphotransfer) domain-containing protein